MGWAIGKTLKVVIEKLQSRKFLLTALMVFNDAIPWQGKAIAVASYLLAESYVDRGRK